ncbi:MAG: DUF6259 domain-containing protein [Treponema sp.]|jgi:hypothetical protein|nr:DUF6259 domain-containing protein [Treponema sp.]
MFTLESDTLTIGFDESSGSLVSLYSKVSQWTLLDRPRLGLSWRFLLPLEGTLEGKRNNNAWGHLQEKPECVKTSGGVSFSWKGITSEFGGKHKITVTTLCEIKNEQAVFSMTIVNNDAVYVENVYYPYLGDIRRPKGAGKFSLINGGYCAVNETSLYPSFPNTRGYFGDDYPVIMTGAAPYTAPMYPFALLSDEKGNGIYLGIAERRIEATTWMAELHPGYGESMGGKAPDTDVLAGKEVFTRFGPVHFPYVAPGASFELLPFGMEAYRGNWNTGVSCYTKLSRTWNKDPVMPGWARDPHAWLQLHINSPEDELRIKYRDLPKVGEDCVKHGIRAIQLVGWNNGGQDRGNPYHDTDPRLGTFEELKEAIGKIHAMGVKVILFSKFVWADRSLENFEKDFLPLAIKDPYGDYYMHPGYQYQTASQWMDINTRRLIPMCFMSKEYLELCKREFKKLLDLGAAGMLYDECLHHGPALCCFDMSHGHRYGAPVYSADEALIDAFAEITAGREFMIAGEAIYDFQHDYYHLSYTRTSNPYHKPVSRFLRPRGAIMTAVTGFTDRNMINQCLLNRYIISYEPYNFKGMPSDFPEATSYGAKMDALRGDLREYFWDGEFRDKLGGAVTAADGKDYTDYAVFTGTNGKTGMVICNYDDTPVRVKPSFEKGSPSRFRLVDEASPRDIEAGSLTIPGKSAAAVI